jgi:hypothetical protein
VVVPGSRRVGLEPDADTPDARRASIS